jgi:hypothetical protein
MTKFDLISLGAIGAIATIGTAAVMPTIVAEVRSSSLEHTAKKPTQALAITKKVEPTENSAAQLVKFSLALGAMAAIFKDWS